MKAKLLTLTLLMFSVAVFAQTKEANYGPFETNKFADNWFISVGGGAQVLFGEMDGEMSLGKRLAPSFDLSIGKWIVPDIGFRAQFSGIQANGAINNSSARFVTDELLDFQINGVQALKEKFNVFNLHGDVLWNISNTIGGYKPSRTWDFIPYAGAGYVRSWKKDRNPVYKEVGFTFGLINEIRLSDAVNFNVEFRALLVNDRFDGYKVGEGIEEVLSATVGFTYNFKKRGFENVKAPIVPDYSSYTSRISDLEKQIADANARNSRLTSDLQNERNKPAVKETEYVTMALAVFFEIGKHNITDKDLINLNNFAEMVKQSGKTYTILGSADKATGTSQSNQKLSESRANAVYDALVNKFGVQSSQLKIEAYGDTQEPFDKPVLNRVVILE